MLVSLECVFLHLKSANQIISEYFRRSADRMAASHSHSLFTHHDVSSDMDSERGAFSLRNCSELIFTERGETVRAYLVQCVCVLYVANSSEIVRDTKQSAFGLV